MDQTDAVLQHKLYSAHSTVQSQAFRTLLTQIKQRQPAAIEQLRQLLLDLNAPSLPRIAAFYSIPQLVRLNIITWQDAQEMLIQAVTLTELSPGVSSSPTTVNDTQHQFEQACIVEVQLELARLVSLQSGSFSLPYKTRHHPLIMMMDRIGATLTVHLMLPIIEDTIQTLIQPQANDKNSANCPTPAETADRFLHCVRAPLIYAITTADTTTDAEGIVRIQTCSMLVRLARHVYPLKTAPLYTTLIDMLIEGWRSALASSPGHPTIISIAEMILDVNKLAMNSSTPLLLSSSSAGAAAQSSKLPLYLSVGGLIWAALLDGSMAHQPISAWIRLLLKFFTHYELDNIDNNYRYLSIVGTAFLLSTTILPSDIAYLLNLWQTLTAKTVTSRLALLAAYPLLQLSMEATTVELRAEAKTLFDKLVFYTPSVDEPLEEWQSLIGVMKWTGQWAVLVQYTHQWLFDNSKEATSIDTTTPMGRFFHISQLFASSHSPSLNHFVFVQPELAHLPILFHLLRASNDKARIAILLQTLPHLAVDAHGTAVVVKVATGLLAYRKNGSLAAIGLRMLFATWRINPRVWRIVRSTCIEWVQQRQQSPLDTHQTSMELAVVFSLKDAITLRSKECGEDVLSLVASLLHCRLTPISIVAIIDIISICVQTNIVDVRTVWTVLVLPIANLAKKQYNSRILCALCRFFSLAGNIREDTEGYVQFKQTILKDFLYPFAFPHIHPDGITVDDQVKGAALMALSHFTIEDKKMILPDSSRELFADILAHTHPAHARFLSSLVEEEIIRMRRGLMKGNMLSNSLSNGETRWIDAVKTSLTEWQLQWSAGDMPTSLASIGAIATLHRLETTNDTTCTSQQIGDLARDATFSDNFIWRLLALPSWSIYFQRLLQQSNPGKLATICYTSITNRLDSCRIPKDIGNLIFALGGLGCALHRCTSPAAPSLILRSVRLLMSEKRKPQPASGDYANFATTIVLGQLVSLLALDEPLVKQVAILLQQGLATSNTRDGGGHEGWQFGIMNGIARLLKSLYEAVTLSDQSWALREELLDLLIASLHPSYQISVLGSLGAGLGLGELSQIFKSIQSVVYPTAVQLINNEIGNEQKSNKMAGAAWVVAMSTTKSDRATQLELLNKLQSTMLLNQEHWTEGWPAVQVAHAYLLHLHLQTSGQQSAILSEYHAYINGQLEVIESSNTPSAYRQMAVMNLAVALGLNWSVSTKEGIVPFYFVDASTEAIHRLWKACLPSPTINMRDVKSNRMVGLIIVRWANELQMGQDVFMKGIGGTGTDKSSNEPRDLSRLPSTSYLRVLFDILAEMVQGGSENESNIKLLVQTLSYVTWQYPSVNWWPVMSRLIEWPYQPIRLATIRLIGRHAIYSASLLKVLQVALLRFATEKDLVIRGHLLGEMGVGRLLTLIGLDLVQPPSIEDTRRLKLNRQRGSGGEGTDQAATISATQIHTVLGGIEEVLFAARSGLNDDRRTYLETLARHLNRTESIKYLLSTDKEQATEETEAAEETWYQTRLRLRQQLIDLSNEEIYPAVKASLYHLEELPASVRLAADDQLVESNYIQIICALVSLNRLSATRYLVLVMQKALDQKISHKQFIDTSHNVLLPALYEEQKRARSTMQFTAEWLIRWLDVLILRVEQPDWPETVQWFIQYLLPGTIQMDMQEEESISIKRQSGIRSIKLEDSLKLLYANEDGESTLHWPQAFYAITIIGDFVVELPPALYDFQCQLVKRLIAVHGYCVTKMQSHWPAQTSTPAFSSTLSTSPLSIFTFPPSCSILWPSLMERVSPILTIQERRHFRLKDTCQ